MDKSFDNHLFVVRLALAKELRKLLKRAYGGSMPSLSRIARDLALRSPNLPQVSNETIRKWLIGASIPSAIAILALADWLGSEILIPLMGKGPVDGKKPIKPNVQSNARVELDAWIQLNRHHSSQPSDVKQAKHAKQCNQEMVDLLQKLSTENLALVVSLINALSTKQLGKDGLTVKKMCCMKRLGIRLTPSKRTAKTAHRTTSGQFSRHAQTPNPPKACCLRWR